MRLVLITVVSLAIAMAASLYLLSAYEAQPAEAATAPEPVLTQVVVASRAIDRGHVLTEGDFQLASMPPEAVSEDMIPADDPIVLSLSGAYAMQTIAQGMPIARSHVTLLGNGGQLSAAIGSGMRAVSIPVNDVMSLGGLLQPDDSVDVILAYALDADALPTSTNDFSSDRDVRAAQTIIHAARILTLDHRFQRSDDHEPGDPVRIATLEVTPDQAERLVLAMRLGDLSLSLVPLAGSEATQDQTVTIDADVTSLLRPNSGLMLASYPTPKTAAIIPVEIEVLAEAEPVARTNLVRIRRGTAPPVLE